MGVTRGNFKAIVKGSGCYHEKRWNVKNSSAFVGHVSVPLSCIVAIVLSRRVCTRQYACSPGKTHTHWEALCTHRTT